MKKLIMVKVVSCWGVVCVLVWVGVEGGWEGLTCPSRIDSPRNPRMRRIPAKPPDTNDTNFATIDINGVGNCFK
jgi:hypothetical protein